MILKRFINKVSHLNILYFSIILSGLFLVLAFINILNHEMWRDELQAWLLGRDSVTIGELLRNMKYEGHPVLWHLGLFLIGKITYNPFFMQIYHILIATAVIFIFARYSPFTRIQKILFTFGYYPFYEYAAISRNYSIGLLFIFASCAIYRSKRPNRFIYLAIVLFLLAHTNIYGLILTFCLSGYFFLDTVLTREKRQWAIKKKVQSLVAIFIIIMGTALSVIQIIPPPDTGYAVEWHTNWNSERALSVLGSVYKAYIPIPVNELHYWNSNIVDSQAICIWLSVAILIISIILVARYPLVLMFFLGGTGGFMAFMYIKYLGFPRHYGHLFILLVAALWLAGGLKFDLKKPGSPLTKGISIIKYAFFIILLAANVYAGILSSYLDGKYTFSMGKAAAKFIKENIPDNKLLAGHRDYAAVTVCGYMGKKIYFPRGNRVGSFIIYNNKRKPIGSRIALDMIKEYAKHRWQDTVLILNFKPKRRRHRNIQIVKGFQDCVVPNEEFFICTPNGASGIYKIERKKR
jgi:hypothetical protein